MVTAEEAQKITEMRAMLETIADRCLAEFISKSVDPTGVNLFNLGRFVAAVEAAEIAAFHVLNVGNAYLHIEACGDALDGSLVAS